MQQVLNAFCSTVKSFKSVQDVQCRQVKCGLQEQIWCSMFKVDRCSMYSGSLPLISNGSVPGHEKLFNVCRYSLYTGVQFGRFHCIYSFFSLVYFSVLTVGNHLLALWPDGVAQPTGTCHSNTELPNSVLLQVNLPDFDVDIVFPEIEPAKLQ